MCVSPVMGGGTEEMDKKTRSAVLLPHFVVVGAIGVLALGKELLEQLLLVAVAGLGSEWG